MKIGKHVTIERENDGKGNGPDSIKYRIYIVGIFSQWEFDNFSECEKVADNLAQILDIL